MNTQNYTAICSVLEQAGLLGLERKLLQYMCCRPISFSLREKISFGNDTLRCDVHAERKGDVYTVNYYDATIIRQPSIPAQTLNQVNLKDLESLMQSVNWQFDQNEAPLRLDDRNTWESEYRVDQVITELTRLGTTDEGKLYADMLRVRFWSDTQVEQLTGNLAAIRSRFEVSQRFYLLSDEVISVDQAYRFLLNRWVEKKMNGQKKQDKENIPPSSGDKDAVMLRKKRIVRTKKP